MTLINLLFFGWAYWIDKPIAGQLRATADPALVLASATAPASASLSVGTPAAPEVAAAAAPVADAANTSKRCASLGPIADRAAATAVKTALQARNLAPRERVAQNDAPDGYWVYIDNLRDSVARARALRRLAGAGVRDAAALASSGQVSVGLFSEKSGADMRAAAVRAAGLEPIIEGRSRPVNQYWFDVELANDIPLPAVAAIVAGLEVDTEPAWRACLLPAAGEAAAP